MHGRKVLTEICECHKMEQMISNCWKWDVDNWKVEIITFVKHSSALRLYQYRGEIQNMTYLLRMISSTLRYEMNAV